MGQIELNVYGAVKSKGAGQANLIHFISALDLGSLVPILAKGGSFGGSLDRSGVDPVGEPSAR